MLMRRINNILTATLALVICTRSSSADSTTIKQFGTSAEDVGLGIAIDPSDSSVYITGATGGALNGQTHAGEDDIFLTKLSSDGTLLYTKQFGTSGSDAGYGIAVNPSDSSVYITGATGGALNGQTHAGEDDIFLMKLSSDGTLLYTKQFGTTSWEGALGIAIDPSDSSVYLTGATGGALNGQTHAGKEDIFLIKISADGTLIYTKQFGTTSWDAGWSIAIDPIDSSVYITGSTGDALNGQTYAGKVDIFLMKLSSDGTLIYTKQFGTRLGADIGWSIAINPIDSSVYIAGETAGGLVGDDDNDDEGMYIFVLKLSSNGDLIYTKQLRTNSDGMTALSIDPGDSSVYITGNTRDFQDSAIILMKLSSDGTLLYTKQFGTSSDDAGLGIVVEPGGSSVYITGYTYGAWNGQKNAGEDDFFLLKVSSDPT
jgi:hypothetical protein